MCIRKRRLLLLSSSTLMLICFTGIASTQTPAPETPPAATAPEAQPSTPAPQAPPATTAPQTSPAEAPAALGGARVERGGFGSGHGYRLVCCGFQEAGQGRTATPGPLPGPRGCRT